MPINSIGPAPSHNIPPTANNPAEQPAAEVQGVEAARAEDESRTRENVQGDTVEISQEARMASQAQKVPATEESQEVRPDMVKEAREYLEAQRYNERGEIERTAEKLVPLIDVEA